MNSIFRASALSMAFLLVACATPPREGPLVGSEGLEVPGGRGLTTGGLDDRLAQMPGVTVNGSGSRARIHVSGADYPNPPLFVIDGLVIGFDFAAVYSQVVPSDVQSIEVIRATHTAAARYGSRGGNGVIEITLRRGP